MKPIVCSSTTRRWHERPGTSSPANTRRMWAASATIRVRWPKGSRAWATRSTSGVLVRVSRHACVACSSSRTRSHSARRDLAASGRPARVVPCTATAAGPVGPARLRLPLDERVVLPLAREARVARRRNRVDGPRTISRVSPRAGSSCAHGMRASVDDDRSARRRAQGVDLDSRMGAAPAAVCARRGRSRCSGCPCLAVLPNERAASAAAIRSEIRGRRPTPDLGHFGSYGAAITSLLFERLPHIMEGAVDTVAVAARCRQRAVSRCARRAAPVVERTRSTPRAICPPPISARTSPRATVCPAVSRRHHVAANQCDGVSVSGTSSRDNQRSPHRATVGGDQGGRDCRGRRQCRVCCERRQPARHAHARAELGARGQQVYAERFSVTQIVNALRAA